MRFNGCLFSSAYAWRLADGIDELSSYIVNIGYLSVANIRLMVLLERADLTFFFCIMQLLPPFT